ncbi:hypothetical protein ANN_15777 [Periplaneta americana]|uniref:Uncharacterized protein n=1 Tax=Periplaneta americana TaxID=6978 RepID=A0ABQ8SHW2_PERAM|nr:hypothetical protein ANN_15777 [Periplaneta americana]
MADLCVGGNEPPGSLNAIRYPTAKNHMASGRMIWVAILLCHDGQSIHGIAGSRSPSLLYQNEVVLHSVAILTAFRQNEDCFFKT